MRFEVLIKDDPQADPAIVIDVKQARRLRIAIDEFLEDHADGK